MSHVEDNDLGYFLTLEKYESLEIGWCYYNVFEIVAALIALCTYFGQF